MERFFVRRPIFAIVISIVIVLLGIISIGRLPVEQYPDITPPVVSVSATYTGADAVEVNNAVAVPVSQSIMGVSNMLYMQTTSANDGSMSMEILFDINSSPDMDEVFTQNNVSTATALLPTSVTQQGVITRKIQTGFLLVYSIYSDGRYDDKFLSNYAYINLQDALLQINGVGKVQIMGAGEYSMRVWIRPEMMDYYGVSVAQISDAIEAQGSIFPTGKLGEQPLADPVEFTYTLTTPPQINTAEQYGQIVISTTPDGEQVRLSDVARLELGSQSYGVSSDFNGNPAALMIVYQTPGSNAMKVGTAVKARMAELADNFIDGVDYSTVVDATTSIKAGVDEIVLTLIFALVLVIAVIFLFLQDWRATLIPLVAIPVSIVGAFMIFPLLGFSINIISLLGLVLAIGLVVDDAIVVVEAVQVNIEKGMERRAATIDAMRNVSSPIIATTVVLLAVFLPVSFVGGVTGKLFQQFSIGIAVSVVISAFNALTLSPALCSILLKHRERTTKGFFGAFNRWFDRKMKGYMHFSDVVMRHALRTFLFIVVVCGAIVALFKLLPDGFLPTEDQGYIMVSVDLPDAASVTRTVEAIDNARQVIGSIEGVAAQSTAAGFNLLSGIASSNSGIIFVTLKPYNQRTNSASRVASLVNEQLYFAVPEGEFYAFEPPSIPGLGNTSGITFSLQARGTDDVGYLAAQTQSFIEKARKLPELSSVSTQFTASVPQRKIVVDRNQAMQQGVDLAQLHSVLSTYLGGTYVNNFNRFGKLYQTYIQADPEYRRTEADIDNFYLVTSNGSSVPLASFVSVVDTVGVEYISQFNLFNAIAVNAAPNAKYSTRQAMDALQELVDTQMPSDITLAWSGVSFQEASSSSSGAVGYLFAIIFVFLALAALYDSWALPWSILLSLPFAIFGAMLFVWLAHLVDATYINNVFMIISLIMLIGLAAKNAILVVEYADRLFFEQGLSLEDAALGAAKLRVRPILMTALSFIFGVLPLVFASGAYSVARNIMGLALVGGMAVATVLGIFVYPALYYIVGRAARFDRKRERRAKLSKI